MRSQSQLRYGLIVAVSLFLCSVRADAAKKKSNAVILSFSQIEALPMKERGQYLAKVARFVEFIEKEQAKAGMKYEVSKSFSLSAFSTAMANTRYDSCVIGLHVKEPNGSNKCSPYDPYKTRFPDWKSCSEQPGHWPCNIALTGVTKVDGKVSPICYRVPNALQAGEQCRRHRQEAFGGGNEEETISAAFKSLKENLSAEQYADVKNDWDTNLRARIESGCAPGNARRIPGQNSECAKVLADSNRMAANFALPEAPPPAPSAPEQISTQRQLPGAVPGTPGAPPAPAAPAPAPAKTCFKPHELGQAVQGPSEEFCHFKLKAEKKKPAPDRPYFIVRKVFTPKAGGHSGPELRVFRSSSPDGEFCEQEIATNGMRMKEEDNCNLEEYTTNFALAPTSQQRGPAETFKIRQKSPKSGLCELDRVEGSDPKVEDFIPGLNNARLNSRYVEAQTPDNRPIETSVTNWLLENRKVDFNHDKCIDRSYVNLFYALTALQADPNCSVRDPQVRFSNTKVENRGSGIKIVFEEELVNKGETGGMLVFNHAKSLVGNGRPSRDDSKFQQANMRWQITKKPMSIEDWLWGEPGNPNDGFYAQMKDGDYCNSIPGDPRADQITVPTRRGGSDSGAHSAPQRPAGQ